MCVGRCLTDLRRYNGSLCSGDSQNYYPARRPCAKLLDGDYSPCTLSFFTTETFTFKIESTTSSPLVTTVIEPYKSAVWSQGPSDAAVGTGAEYLQFTSGSSRVTFLGLSEDGDSYVTTAGNCSMGATCTAGGLSFVGNMAAVPSGYTLDQPPVVLYYLPYEGNDLISVATTGKATFQNDDGALATGQSQVPFVEVSKPSVYGGAYTLSNFEVTNVRSYTPFLTYDYELNGEVYPGDVVVCKTDSRPEFVCVLPP